LPNNLVDQIENTSLADIIRRNTDVTKLQENVFFFNESTVMIDSTVHTSTSTDAGQGNNDNNGRNGNGRHEPPQAAIDACSTSQLNDACSFTGRNNNTVNGSCQTPQSSSQLVCVPSGRRP
ncbi:MAG: hypothetical protein J0M11_16605, partial [Anaerolineae bacterium]|nr:hypothetical protein [Anaerolineae bacterium]